ncbi:MAG: DUF115 domain-containing protein [Hyphomonadaceae bacterium]|nr:DUF115 domain-containing protein [Hyphomonadaceae bacterium]
MTDSANYSSMRRLLGPLGFNILAKTNIYKTLRDPGWTLSRLGKRNKKSLLNYKNVHQGKTGFIVGTGPSLLDMNLVGLKSQITIGLNRLYMGIDRIGFQPTYMVCVNELLLSENSSDFSQLKMPLFANWESRAKLRNSDHCAFFRTLAGTHFHKNLTQNISVGSTVTYSALQLAYWMGFKRIILVGIDHNYQLETGETKLAPHTKVERLVNDKNHFHPDYFGKGSVWQLPDLETSEAAYREAKIAFESSGREILDATRNGKLDVFKKVKLSEVLKEE